MSAHIPCPHCVRFAATFTHLTQSIKCELTFALFQTSEAIFADFGALASDLQSAINTYLKPAMDGATLLNGVIIEDVRTVPYGGLSVPQTPAAGTIGFGGTLLPTDTCMAVKRSSSSLGRSARGRVYWPIWTAGWQDDADRINSGHAATVVTQLNAFQTHVELLDTGVELGEISTVHAGAPRSSGVFYQTSNWAVTDLLMDSQRRRLVGRGP